MRCDILIIDDEETYGRSLQRLFARRGYSAVTATTGSQALTFLREDGADVALVDYLLPDIDGLDLLTRIKEQPDPPLCMMMTAFGTIEKAVRAMQLGAFDYVTKSVDLGEVLLKASRALDAQRMRRELEARRADAARGGRAEIVGRSPAIRAVLERIEQVAASDDTTVLVVGESGTGKELAARMIHALSRRSRAPFVEIDCAAISPSLLESELFGHERGAFTGAVRQKPGLLELAGEGTAFLDEIGDLDSGLQGKLLRVIQQRTYFRVGGTRKVQFNARVVAATNRDLARAMSEGRFRADLFHRLSAFPVVMPPLREREGDVELLANHFIAELGGKLGKSVGPVQGPVLRLLEAYDYPGNVRELRNIIEQAMILCRGQELTPDLLPARVRDRDARASAAPGGIQVTFQPGVDTLDDVNRSLLARALELAGGHKTRAAELLGISRYALNRRCEKYGIEVRGEERV